MQHETDRTDAVPAKSLASKIWGTIAALMALALLAGAGWMYSQINATNNREFSSSPFPWTVGDVTVANVTAWWKSAEGDARMEMRAGYYPVARIRLGACTGSGMMTVTFHDELNRQVGEAIHMPYRDGQFTKRDENWVRAEGSLATCRVEAGYENKQALELIQIQPEMPLWRVKVIYRADGDRTAHRLGFITIQTDEVKEAE